MSLTLAHKKAGYCWILELSGVLARKQPVRHDLYNISNVMEYTSGDEMSGICTEEVVVVNLKY
jgi:hypothetical protein